MDIASIGSTPTSNHDDDADNDDNLSGVYIEMSRPHLNQQQLQQHHTPQQQQQHDRRENNKKRRYNLRYPTCATGVASAAIASEPLPWWRWQSYSQITKLIAITAISGLGLASIHVLTRRYHQYYTRHHPSVSTVAFLGNSMFYFNDFPRFFETIAGGRVVQNSCLHGGASIESLVIQGNAMYPQFGTVQAIIGTNEVSGDIIYDYGACTVKQLLNGDTYDPDTDEEWRSAIDNNNNQQPPSNNTNPCRVDYTYLEYANSYFKDNIEYWDYVVINDNTRNPARAMTRNAALATLEEFYIPWLLETKTIPILLWTHAYTYENTCMTDYADNLNVVMTGLEDIANFTSLTGVGYRVYVDLLASYLPSAQAPRIAPVGLAYLVVHEENYEVWQSLFHCDNLHASPSGSFLQGCIIYYTLFGVMPSKDVIIKEDMSTLWDSARVMQHYWEPSNKFPDIETAMYLYRVAERVVKEGHIPSSFINYQNGEVAYEET